MNKEDLEPRGGRGDGFRRGGGRGGGNHNFNHYTYEPEVERQVHLTRNNENLIVRIQNDHYNANRRGTNTGNMNNIRQNSGTQRSGMRNANNNFSVDGLK